MSSKVIYERFLWFHNQAKQLRYPNAPGLANKFELSHKTAQRDIEFMRDRIGAPLAYVRACRGYVYEDESFDLPGLWLSAGELTSLLVSYRLATTMPDKSLKTTMKSFLNHALSLYTSSKSISLDNLNEKVSVKNIEYSLTNENTFHQVLDALLHTKPLRIEYYSPHNDEHTVRDILPLHLLSYMGTWHIIAHCTLRNETRDFTLSRIRSIAPSQIKIIVPASLVSIKEYIRRNFGIMNSEESMEVCLRFSKDAAPWIAEQVWHPKQQASYEPDGRLCLTLPVADFREIKREVLKYGHHVEVLSPLALRDEVKDEIEKMNELYR
ncbi:MAG TPA: WYL domain-containing protein [Deltaproteobacteria bacterium]|nr:WYL domain-containing protein [Deltaproteobacteria bacterium]